MLVTDVQDVSSACETTANEAIACLQLDSTKVVELLSSSNSFSEKDKSPQWKHVCLNIHLLSSLKESISEDYVFSVQEMKKLKTAFRNLCTLGIFPNILPNLPRSIKVVDSTLQVGTDLQIIRYYRLTTVLNSLMTLVRLLQFRSLIIPEFLKTLLVALYQLVYCPLKKPTNTPDKSGFTMTNEFHTQLLKDRTDFRNDFEYLRASVYKPIYVRETMRLMSTSAPPWFRNAVASNLNTILSAKGGVQSVAAAMFDGTTDDSAKTWNTLDVLTKLILGCKNAPDFRENICQQVVGLLNLQEFAVYERLFTSCTRKLFGIDRALCEEVFVNRMLKLNLRFASKNNFSDGEDVTDAVNRSVRLCHSCFVEYKADCPPLPTALLKTAIVIVFRLYLVTTDSSMKSTNNDARAVLLSYLSKCDDSETFQLLDAALFGICADNQRDITDLMLVVDGQKIVAKHSNHKILYNVHECGDAVLKLFEGNSKLLSCLFSYLLACLIEKDTYVKVDDKQDLFHTEDVTIIPESMQKKLVIFRLLSILTDARYVQNFIIESPKGTIKYMSTLLNRTIKANVHKTTEYDSDAFHTLYTTVVVLQAMSSCSSEENLQDFATLVEPITLICAECQHVELKCLLETVLKVLTGQCERRKHTRKKLTELEKALEDVHSHILPVRGHGLITLTKLLEMKHSETMQRTHYLLTIFQVSFFSKLANAGISNIVIFSPATSQR